MPLFSFFSGLRPGPRQGLCPWTPLGAPPPNPWPAFEKSGGKPAGKLLWGSGELCRPAAHRERRARFLYRKPGRKGMVDGSLGPVEIPAYRGGRRQGAKRPERASPGPLAPGLALLFGRPRGGPGAAPRPPNAAAPRRDPGASTNVKKARQKPGLTAYPATSRPPLGEANFYADSIVFSGEFPYSRR